MNMLLSHASLPSETASPDKIVGEGENTILLQEFLGAGGTLVGHDVKAQLVGHDVKAQLVGHDVKAQQGCRPKRARDAQTGVSTAPVPLHCEWDVLSLCPFLFRPR